MELRQAIEGECAYYAALRGSHDDLERLYHTFSDLEKAVLEQRLAADEDLAFHMSIAKAAQNRTIAKVMNMVSDQLMVGLEKSRANTLKRPGKSHSILEEHRNIYEAIKDGHSQLAREAMWDHLQKVKQRYL